MQSIIVRQKKQQGIEEICIGNNIISSLVNKKLLNKYDKVLFVADVNVYEKHKVYIGNITKSLDSENVILVKPELEFKDFNNCGIIFDKLVDMKASRKSCLVAIGGGYVGDLVGFTASVYMRGIDFVQIPSTFMAMADGVIGKVAINYNGHKNIIGSFYSPRYIFCDINLLQSLKEEEILFGMVEVWKHALLKNNHGVIEKIETFLNGGEIDLEKIIYFSMKTKKDFVKADLEDTKGKHKALSLGHTFANYLEAHKNFRHGVAVFYGIIFSTILSFELGKISNKKYQAILSTTSLFEKRINGLKKLQIEMDVEHILEMLKFDKINSHGGYSFVLLDNGGYMVNTNMSKELIRKGLNDLKELSFE